MNSVSFFNKKSNKHKFSGSNIDYGGNAAVYSARLRDLDVRRALTGNFQGVLNSNEDNLKVRVFFFIFSPENVDFFKQMNIFENYIHF